MPLTKPTAGLWEFKQSVGGKWYTYGADGRPIIVPNVSGTGRSKEEIEANLRLIAVAVNYYREKGGL